MVLGKKNAHTWTLMCQDDSSLTEQHLGLIFFIMTHFGLYSTDLVANEDYSSDNGPLHLHSHRAGWGWPCHTCTTLLFRTLPGRTFCHAVCEAFLEKNNNSGVVTPARRQWEGASDHRCAVAAEGHSGATWTSWFPGMHRAKGLVSHALKWPTGFGLGHHMAMASDQQAVCAWPSFSGGSGGLASEGPRALLREYGPSQGCCQEGCWERAQPSTLSSPVKYAFFLFLSIG